MLESLTGILCTLVEALILDITEFVACLGTLTVLFRPKVRAPRIFLGLGMADVSRFLIGAHRAPQNFWAVTRDEPLVGKVQYASSGYIISSCIG